ncbi:carboxymuconolactone decarboxylase family protein [Vibrio parahaemolyticus]|uniref:carboxymuconolactone decarboxylase family protein n=1 Tax=Vibrio parahaemolyticus TaxID=670 RepID=UPI00111D7ABB|nr:carboxymuconolactone decarboxylase family protein [Vibrio parahaemolyticus]EJG0913818.1 carboxymuconolactone decarboxylase family protein [Vibrio parahaemolyticus]MBE3794221.1 carboxymuconolactone decarboxylase family protein [Vibrio parahaemolyticus]TOM09809.1 carboxymuconolactone decarboxylase family protein [Vibrio parahaemolyticus]TOM27772.1 carboxymuconolactone decarboxylase family protein [Vibrio parahaemolyticus]TOM38431.1 carboxymuconolactone decarboxylase family protein [Vibrio par
MLGKHQKGYEEFYHSTHENEHLDTRTELLVGLSAAMAMNCLPCTRYYLLEAKKAGISKGEISDVTAKVMAVAAGQKKLQMQEVLTKYNIDLDSFE